MQAVLYRLRLGNAKEVDRQALPSVQRGIAAGVDLDRTTEHPTPPARQSRRVAAVDGQRGDAHNRWCLITHAEPLANPDRTSLGVHDLAEHYRMRHWRGGRRLDPPRLPAVIARPPGRFALDPDRRVRHL
jgi:hypothetical protein